MNRKKIFLILVLILISITILFRGRNKTNENKIDSNSTKEAVMEELKVEDIKVGSGRESSSGDTITVNYKGTFLDGREFDSSYGRGEPFIFKLGAGNVIEGWDKGLVGMKVGGKRKLIIPPQMAYGERGAGSDIPPNTTLIFEVELLEVQ